MKSKLGVTITKEMRGIVYLCSLYKDQIVVETEMFFGSAFAALDTYANTRNPPSQLVTAKSYDELCEKLKTLHLNMGNPEWLRQLHEQI